MGTGASFSSSSRRDLKQTGGLSTEEQIRRNLVTCGAEALVLHTILFNRPACEAFIAFITKQTGPAAISLYIDLLNCKLIEESAHEGERVDSDFFESLVGIVDKYLDSRLPPAVKEILHFLRDNHGSLMRSHAVDRINQIAVMLVGVITPWLGSFETSNELELLAMKQSNTLLFPGVFSRLSRHTQKASSFVNRYFTSCGDVLILERQSLQGKLLTYSLLPFFRSVIWVRSTKEAEQALLDRCFSVLAISIGERDSEGLHLARPYLKRKASCKTSNEFDNIAIDATQSSDSLMSVSKRCPSHTPTVIVIATEMNQELNLLGFKSVLIRPFSVREFINAAGGGSAATVMSSIADLTYEI